MLITKSQACFLIPVLGKVDKILPCLKQIGGFTFALNNPDESIVGYILELYLLPLLSTPGTAVRAPLVDYR